MNRLIIFLALLLIVVPFTLGMQASMPLLAVKETDSGYEGSTAELFLEIKEGSGRVFVDTFPLSKIDTQISMRFAKEIACDFIDADCSVYDFIYTIRANSPIIGGPSAGAAATVLTVSLLSGSDLKKNTAITGTINSGALIGPVGGIKEKIVAGAGSGLKKILIPSGEVIAENDTNNSGTLNMTVLADELGIEIIEVSDLNTALIYFTGKDFKPNNVSIQVSPIYTNTMKTLAADLCDRNDYLFSTITIDDTNESQELYDLALNLSDRGNDAFDAQEYYAAASYCFGSNLRMNQIFFQSKKFSQLKYEGLFEELRKNITAFESEIDNKQIQTITDLESYMVVKERISDALIHLNSSDNTTLSYDYAYAIERIISAYSWSEFFKNSGKKLNLDQESLKESCRQKIAETEERFQYVSLYFPLPLLTAKQDLENAYRRFNEGEYALCLFEAAKSKAEVDVILNTLGVEEAYLPQLIEDKLDAVSGMIVDESKEGIFPVLGFSYYEYAQNLKNSDIYSSMLYAEYALEFSNLGIYFQEGRQKIDWRFDVDMVAIIILALAVGSMIGFAAASFIFRKRSRKANRKK